MEVRIVPKSEKRTTEETPHDLQVNDRKVATCIRVYEADLEKFQTIAELKGTMSGHVREFIHDYLNHNGFSDIALMNRKRKLHQQKRDIDKELYTINIKLSQDLQAEFQQDLDLLEERKMRIFIGKRITMLAKDIYFAYKDNLNRYGDAKLGPTLALVKGRMGEFKKMPGFNMTPNELQNEIKEIIEKNREQWDVELEQEGKKYPPRGY